GRLLLERARHATGKRRLHRVRARGVRGQVTAAVRGADLEAGEAIERALEDQVREGDRGLERIADGVRQETVAAEPARALELGRALRMDEHKDAELFGLGPERMEPGVAELEAVHAAARSRAAEAVALDTVLKLLGRQVGMLQRDGGERDEPVGLGRADLGERLVLDA